MKYISDDGECIGNESEVREYEARQKQLDSFDAEIGAYLDSVEIKEGDTVRNLNSREFTRRAGVIKAWLQWDRDQHPERYQEREPAVEAQIKAVAD